MYSIPIGCIRLIYFIKERWPVILPCALPSFRLRSGNGAAVGLPDCLIK